MFSSAEFEDVWNFTYTSSLHGRMRVKYPLITVAFILANAKLFVLVQKSQLLEDMWDWR
jgi:hypothetical protein